MEDNVDAVTHFLKEFTTEKVSPTSDDDVQIRGGIVGNYSLKPEEIDGEVTDWVLNYLEQRKCPYFLAVSLAKKVAQQVSTNVCKRLLHSNGECIPDETDEVALLQNATSLHAEAINLLRELCNQMLADPKQTENFVAQPLHFRASVFAIKNGRRKMEDRHVVLHDLNTVCNLQNAPSHSYYAVFDGHAGVETASFASAHLHINMAQHPSFLKDTKKAIIDAFKLTDTQFSERAYREGLKSGATAVCALIRESTLYVAWAGDSQALLVKQGKPHAIMNPHKPEREDERKRIEELGGYVYHHGTWRVNGTLAVSRALGDIEHKPFVSSEPEITVITLDGSEDFLVIACDGLWDKMSPSDVAVGLYRHLVDNPHDVDGIAAKLVHQSKVMGSYDNITTIVVFLRDIPSLIADAPKYASIFPQLEGIDVKSVSQMANGTGGRSYQENEGLYELENKQQRPTYFQKDLDFSSLDPSDWSPSLQGTHILDRDVKFGVAEGMPPEQTSLSELPTPPIDEVVASKQFSQYSTSEQLKMFQEHLEAQGFHDVSLDEIQTSMSENLQFLPSEIQDDMGYLADNVQPQVAEDRESKLLFEDISDLPQHLQSDLSDTKVIRDQEAPHVTHQELLNTASDIVLNTIETAVKHVSSSDSCQDLSSGFNDTHNPFEKQSTDNTDSSMSFHGEPNTVPQKSSYQLNPNAEPFVMKKDFSSFNPFSSSPVGSGAAGEVLLDTSTVSSLSDVLVVDTFDSGIQGDVAPMMLDTKSPLPSAPPLEGLGEEQKSRITEGYEDHADIIPSAGNNPFCSNLESNTAANEIQSVLITSAVQELENQSSAGLALENVFCVQEVGSQQSSVCDLLSQNPELVGYPTSVQGLTDMLPPLSQPAEHLPLSPDRVGQPPAVQEIVEQSPVVQEALEQLAAIQETVEQPPPAVQETVEQPPAAQETVEQPPLVLPELQTEVQKLPSDDSLQVQELVEKRMMDHSDLASPDKGSSHLIEFQDSLSDLSAAGCKGFESKSSVGTEMAAMEHSSATEILITEESHSILEYSVDKSKDSAQNTSPQRESFVDLEAKDNLGSSDGVSKEVTKQVIGKDSLLPKEVQAKLLEVTSTTLPSESVSEDAPVGAVAVDLKTIPDGIPEAEGVTEDMDSDSEKDGGWSYVKASSSSGEPKATKRASDTNKVTSKKAVPSSAKDRKLSTKTTGDAHSRQKGGGTSVITDATKKVVPEKADRKVVESRDKKDRSVTASKTASPQPVVSKTLTSDRKLIKKTTTTVSQSVPSKPATVPNTVAPKQAVTNVTSRTTTSTLKTASSAIKPPVGGPEKVIGKPAHSSTPFRPNLQKPSPSAGTAKPLTRPASATSAVASSAGAPKQSDSSQKSQPRALSAPLTTKTLPGTKLSTTTVKSNTSAAPGADIKPKPPASTFRRPLPAPTKKQDVKETKDSTNKQISAKKTTTQVSSSVSTTTSQVRRTGVPTSALKVDVVSKKSSPSVTSDAKAMKTSTGRPDVAKSSTLSKTAAARGRIQLQSKPKTLNKESDKKLEANRSKNGPKKIIGDTPSSDQKCSADNRTQEVTDEKGMLEVNAQETANSKSAGAGLDSLIDVPVSDVSKSELKQESNVTESPMPVPPAEENV